MPAEIELMFHAPRNAQQIAELLKVAANAERVREHFGECIANRLLISAISFGISANLDEDFCRKSTDYLLGQLYAHLAMPERAAKCFERSQTLPHSGGNPVYSDQVAESLRLRERQMTAIERGVPHILIASMPRAASASLTQTISATLDVPVMRVSAGAFPNYSIVPRWLDHFSAGGAVTHDHFGASDFNIATLVKAGIKNVFLLVRDPRAGAFSYVNYVNAKEPINTEFLDAYRILYMPWLLSWLTAADDVSSPLHFHWIKSEDARTHPGQVIRQILTTLADDYPAAAELAERPIVSVTENFVSGDDDRWRSHLPDEVKSKLWNPVLERAQPILNLQH